MIFGSSVEKIEQLAKKKKTKKILPYTKSKKSEIRLAAIRYLGISGGEEAFNRLTQFLGSSDAQERLAAAEALGVLGRPQASSFLSYYIDKETDSKVLQAMKTTMTKLRQSN